MKVVESVDAGARRATEVLEEGATRPRNRLLRIVDPWDVAGHAGRAVLPTHATPDAAHAVYYVLLGGFVLAELVEPPVALMLAVGHVLLHSHNRYLQSVAEALDDTA